MKKRLALLLALTLTLTSFVACGTKEETPAPPAEEPTTEEPVEAGYTDGEYFAEMADFDDQGWKDNATVTITDGKIASVVLNSNNKDGKTKLEAVASGEYDMTVAGAKEGWDVQTGYIGQYIVDNQGTEGITFDAEGKSDAVTGATISYSHYADLVNQALTEASAK